MLQTDFLGGVVEGFYGKVWTRQERLDLLNRIAALGLGPYQGTGSASAPVRAARRRGGGG